MSTASTFQKVLEKYRFLEPVAADMQLLILRTKRPVLVSALRALDEYGFFYGLSLRVFFTLRRYGMAVTMRQSQFITAGVGLVLAAVMTLGLYLSIPPFEPAPYEAPPLEMEKIVPYVVPDREAPKDDRPAPHLPYRIGIEEFGAENTGAGDAAVVREKIRTALASGPLGPYLRRSRDTGEKANILLMGSLGRMGTLDIVTVRLVDVAKGSVLYTTTENASSPVDLDRACWSVSERIGEFMAGYDYTEKRK